VTLTNPRFPISARGAAAAALLVLGTLAPLAARRADANVAIPRPGATAPAATGLAARIDSILRRPALRQAQWGIEMRDAATGRLLYARDAERRFIPASNLKLVVAAAAAHHLPAGFRFRTTLLGTGPVVNGTLRGDMVLYGRGDPMISDRYFPTRAAVWEMLADSLRARGITRVSGAVVADESWFDTEYVRGDWETYDTRWWYGAPVSALGFNDNSIDFRVEGAPGRPRITWEPRSSYVTLENAATTAAGPATIDFERAGSGVRAYGTFPAGAAPPDRALRRRQRRALRGDHLPRNAGAPRDRRRDRRGAGGVRSGPLPGARSHRAGRAPLAAAGPGDRADPPQ
jgi:D-alanyl-D-alanine carboxypeptidase/D-alanyl-D-alanine-endopeptidase (penicillin-binding protein 4)